MHTLQDFGRCFSPRGLIRPLSATLLLLLIALPLAASAQQLKADAFTMDIIDNQGRPLQLYPVDDRRAYLRAEQGQSYAIKMTNRTNVRIGLVIAIDGFNIISGTRSELRANERMYLLGPKQTRVYKGWRAGPGRIKRFFFTDAMSSRAGQWGDHSAIGVIAVAAFGEQPVYGRKQDQQSRKSGPSQLGTGAGMEKYAVPSPVAFAPQNQAFVRYFIKYESVDSLCERSVINCTAPDRFSLNDVSIDIVDDRDRRFAQFPIEGKPGVYRAYLEAFQNAVYAIRMRNNSNQRIGLVIAVDGRNIISGKRSELARNERMYILNPGESAAYQGWRTGKNKVNQFYFTTVDDSYADAWNDRSAVGVIAVAVFQEDRLYEQELTSATVDRPRSGKRSQPGTGFGDDQYSPSREVEFEPRKRASAEYFVKYEWRESLCRKGVIRCQGQSTDNRLWDDKEQGYAPAPEQTQSWQHQYARIAVDQYEESVRRRCGFRGARWHADYQGHYSWAKTISKQRALAETKFRKSQLRACG